MSGGSQARRHGEYVRELRSYVVGLAFAIVLTAIPFAAVALGGWPRRDVLWLIAGCALVQVVCHFRFFLHIDLSRSKREDLQLILFAGLLVVLMVGGTLWVLYSQRMHMM